MVTILPPDTSITFITAVLVPLAIGFLVGIVIKSTLKVGIAIAIIILLLIVAGIISPNQVIQPLVSLIRSGSGVTSKVSQLVGYLPYSSLTFIIGLAIGFFKG